MPDELVERLWLGRAKEDPYSKAQQALAEIEADLEGWSERIAAEKAHLCREVLGVGTWDGVVFDSRGKAYGRMEGGERFQR